MKATTYTLRIPMDVERYHDTDVMQFDGRVLVIGEDDAQYQIGTTSGFFYRHAAFEVDTFVDEVDAIDQDQYELAWAASQVFKAGKAEAYHALGIDRVELIPEARGFDIGYMVAREVIRMFGDQALIVAHPTPIGGGTGKRKLQDYWKRFGLRPLTKYANGFYAHDGAYKWLTNSWMGKYEDTMTPDVTLELPDSARLEETNT